jgi:adapter protein MecA 1/2
MRFERISEQQIKILLSIDDLNNLNIRSEEIWEDVTKVRYIYTEMLCKAEREIGFQADRPIAVEVFKDPNKGYVLFITKSGSDFENEEEYFDITNDQLKQHPLFFQYKCIEDVISAATKLKKYEKTSGNVYAFKNKYYIEIKREHITPNAINDLIAILTEFGELDTSKYLLVSKKGELIVEGTFIKKLSKYFNKKQSPLD